MSLSQKKVGSRKLLEMKGVFMAYIVVIVLWMYTYLKTQVLSIKFVPLIVCQLYLNKGV